MSIARFVSPTDRVLLFKSLPVLASIPLNELLVIAEHAEETQVAKGTELVEQEGPVRHIRFLVEGEARVFWEGVEVEVSNRSRPIGLEGAMAPRAFKRRVVATQPCTMLDVRTDLVLDLMQAYPRLRFALIQRYARAVLSSRDGLPSLRTKANPDGGVRPARPLDLVDRLRMFYEMNPSGSLNLDAMLAMCKAMTEVHIAAGEELWALGDQAQINYMIVSGVVSCEQPDSAPLLIGRGHGFGGHEAMANLPRPYRAVAHTDCVLLRTHGSHMRALFNQNWGAARAWLGMLVMQFVEAEVYQGRQRAAAAASIERSA